jgi:hypothetical protein
MKRPYLLDCKGEKPADLCLTVPVTLQVAADEVIE